MFKNNVFKVSVDTKKWAKAAGVRAVKTVAQTAVATSGTAAVMGAVDWKMVASASVLSGVISWGIVYLKSPNLPCFVINCLLGFKSIGVEIAFSVFIVLFFSVRAKDLIS